jgi:Flp pilus assembly protein TadD
MFMPPSEAQRLTEHGVSALASGQIDAARTDFTAVLRLNPTDPMALTKLAEIDLLHKHHVPARQHLETALATEPNFAPAWGEMAMVLWLEGQRQDAVQAAQKAVDIQPHNPRLRLRLAQFAAWTGHGQQARDALAPLLNPDSTDPITHATALGMAGEIHVAEGRFQEANPYLLEALAKLPTLPTARVVLGMNQLRLGNFAEGWPNAAVRDLAGQLYPDGPPARLGARWTGQDLTGKTLLVEDDQGHGDAIQFFRYLPTLRDRRPAHMTLRTFPPLVRLFSQAAPYATVLAGLPEDANFDFRTTSTDLPRWFATTAETIPAPIPYLRPPSPARKARQRTTLDIGLVWSGDARHMRDHLRSIPAASFLTLADLPGFRFHSLQHEVRPADLPDLEARPSIDRTVEKATDLADTAALIAGLDLVIAVDTGIAHLAGAMTAPGIPPPACSASPRPSGAIRPARSRSVTAAGSPRQPSGSPSWTASPPR